EPWLAWIVSAWMAGIALASMRPCLGWITLRRLRRVGRMAVPDHIADLLQALARQLRVRQAVEVALSSLVEVPVAIGWLRPLVLLPASAVVGLTPAQLQAVLAHELAHIRRHDFLVNVLQTIFETLFFHHPAVWWVSSRLRQEREHCCDDLALELCPDRKEYARMLLSLEELRTVIPALSIRGGALSDRVRRILGSPRPDRGAARSASAGLVILAMGIALWLRPSASVGQTASEFTPKANPPADIKVGFTDKLDLILTDVAAEKVAPQKGRLTGRFVFDDAHRAQNPAATGTLKGSVACNSCHADVHHAGIPDLSGPVPRSSACSSCHANVREQVGKGFGLPNVVIYLTSPMPVVPEDEAESLPAAKLQFVEGKFEPHVQAFRTSQPLVIENRGNEAVDFGAQPAKSEAFRQLLPAGKRMALTFVEERFPVKIASNLAEVSAYVLPRDNPWFAVSGADGSFTIDNLPPGKWRFQIWHELELQRNLPQQGQLTLDIKAGENSLGEFSLQPRTTAQQYKWQVQTGLTEKNRPRATFTDDSPPKKANWLRPDPYPGLGFDRAQGDGWMYVRIAGDAEAAAEAGLDQQVQHFAQTTAKLIEASIQADSVQGKTTPESRKEWWNRGRALVREQITAQQDQRIQQLILQRLTYHAFLREDVARQLELTDEQKNRIQAAIEVLELEALQRQNDLEIRLEKLRSALGPENRDLIEAGVKRLKDKSAPSARASFRDVWRKIHDILLPAQHATFDALRGPMPESARKALQLYLSEPPAPLFPRRPNPIDIDDDPKRPQ
ncbi:MAG TPA: M56 family metallopeptidase, partial [Planctomycetaceae bacterium]|nr:M56 family metallopeptidase [Planctomycetaceae bacterium]